MEPKQALCYKFILGFWRGLFGGGTSCEVCGTVVYVRQWRSGWDEEKAKPGDVLRCTVCRVAICFDCAKYRVPNVPYGHACVKCGGLV